MTKRPTKKAPAKRRGDGVKIADPLAEEVFQHVAATNGFDIRGFDAWLASLPDAGRQTELPERRALAKAAAMPPLENEDALLRHLEWMMLRWEYIRRNEYLLPLARTGKRVRDPFSEANRQRAEESSAQELDWQARANATWEQPQHKDKSANAIAKMIAKPTENPDTIRRKIRKLS